MQDLQLFFISVSVHYKFVVFILFLNTVSFSKSVNMLAHLHVFIQVK